ncbi:DUF5914 domain-containing protein [Amycolatopsis jiangsuensis]|uniref:Nitrite reductase/ring-hydroxylating ferredoxin subunit n=1 Tax=Amycolatopsis jiangsuensis TaxID=1181879 RepID=A0A840IZL8_9PSEU|nr:DUF5914 domain-containing protein [Amycolatopsis jiangsuensis]MBB4686737.1 nitrite reductase/ring-hydroxylating ferredoxin subunit [Amycolatopsis jiangsuensis]
MLVTERIIERWPRRWPVQPFSAPPWARQEPTYRDCSPALIEAAGKRAAARPSGNWFVVAASRSIRPERPRGLAVGGTELVAWRGSGGEVRIGPGACPHLGAPLADARVDDGGLVCRWHGLRIDGEQCGTWSPIPAHDDGVLVWARLDRLGGEPPTDRPVVPRRPAGVRVDAVATLQGTCEPEDVVANRLDPWHGAWFHPYSFSHLRVLEAPHGLSARDDEDRFLVEVTFRIAGRWGVPVLAEFVCPEPRTVVMRIVEGEGTGSVVETHATPLGLGADGHPRTAVIEATVAASPRPGFALAARLAPAIRPLMRHTATRLWRDDLSYAERRYALRAGRLPG